MKRIKNYFAISLEIILRLCYNLDVKGNKRMDRYGNKKSWTVWCLESGRYITFDIKEYFYPKYEAKKLISNTMELYQRPRNVFRLLVAGSKPKDYDKREWVEIIPEAFSQWHRRKHMIGV